MSIIQGISSIFRWELIRKVGGLQLLTRASYTMLLVVPLLAGVWPAVRGVITSYNSMLGEATLPLANAARDLSDSAGTIRAVVQGSTAGTDQTDSTAAPAQEEMASIANAASRIQHLSSTIEKELKTLRQEATLSPVLPFSWALVFFAAVAVAFGHFIYQVNAPEEVRKYSRKEFIRQALNDYRRHRSSYELDDALDWMWDPKRKGRIGEGGETTQLEAARTTPRKKQFDNANEIAIALALKLIKIINQEERVQQEDVENENNRVLGELEGLLRGLTKYERRSIYHNAENYIKDNTSNGVEAQGGINILNKAFNQEDRFSSSGDAPDRRESEIIEMGARNKYAAAAAEKPLAMLAALALYSLGLSVVVYIIWQQCVAVADAADWHTAVRWLTINGLLREVA